MKLEKERIELAIRALAGLPFLIAATCVWSVITVVFFLPLELKLQNIFMFMATGILFPTALLSAKLTGAEWKCDDHPLGQVGLYLNLAQFMYFPILFFVFFNAPENLILFFAIITGAHLFPYGWLYYSKAYFIMAPVMAVGITLIGLTFGAESLWIIPLSMVVFILILTTGLHFEHQRKLDWAAKTTEK